MHRACWQQQQQSINQIGQGQLHKQSRLFILIWYRLPISKAQGIKDMSLITTTPKNNNTYCLLGKK